MLYHASPCRCRQPCSNGACSPCEKAVCQGGTCSCVPDNCKVSSRQQQQQQAHIHRRAGITSDQLVVRHAPSELHHGLPDLLEAYLRERRLHVHPQPHRQRAGERACQRPAGLLPACLPPMKCFSVLCI